VPAGVPPGAAAPRCQVRDPGATATPWDRTRAALETAQLFWITAVHANGRPHVWPGDALHFSTGQTEQKALNLRANPHVVLTTGCSSWKEGLGVMVEGDAAPVTDETRLSRLARVWSAK